MYMKEYVLENTWECRPLVPSEWSYALLRVLIQALAHIFRIEDKLNPELTNINKTTIKEKLHYTKYKLK